MPTQLKPLPPVRTGGKWTQDAKPRLPSRRRSAEFHQVSLSAPVPRWIAFRHCVVNILWIDIRTSPAVDGGVGKPGSHRDVGDHEGVDLRAGGPDFDDGLLVVIDGAKALSAAVREGLATRH